MFDGTVGLVLLPRRILASCLQTEPNHARRHTRPARRMRSSCAAKSRPVTMDAETQPRKGVAKQDQQAPSHRRFPLELALHVVSTRRLVVQKLRETAGK